MTDNDKPIEYEETTETFEDGTTRTTKTPKPPEDESELATKITTMAAARKPHVDIPAHIAQKQRESKLPQDQSEDNSLDE